MSQCQADVWGDFRTHPCGKKGKVKRDGKWYCGIHDPVAKKEKEEIRSLEVAKKNTELSLRLADTSIVKIKISNGEVEFEAPEGLEITIDLSLEDKRLIFLQSRKYSDSFHYETVAQKIEESPVKKSEEKA